MMKKLLQATAVSSLLAFAAAAQQAPAAETAFVRVAHLSPNAQEVSVTIGGGEGLLGGGEGAAVTGDELSGLNYRDVTDYVSVAAGDYGVAVNTPDGTFQEDLTFNAGAYYTIAALGLIAPGGLEQTQVQEDTGFFGFGGGGGDVLAFRLEVLEEDITTLTAAQPAGTLAPGTAADPAAPAAPADPAVQPVDPATDPAAQPVDPAAPAVPPAGQTGTVTDPAAVGPAATVTLVTARLVHAAPGVAPVSLVSVMAATADAGMGDAGEADAGMGEDIDVLIGDVPFGDVSNYNDIDSAQLANLEVRIEESPAAALSLGDTVLDPNTVYTMFVIGTPVGQEPLEVLLVGTTLGAQDDAQDDQQGAAMTGGDADQQQDDQQDAQDEGEDDGNN